jgi:streptomycin 6-kinase
MTGVPDGSERIRAAAAHWHLTVGEPLAGGSRSAVYAAQDERGRDLVLKLPEVRSGHASETAAEAAALTAWASTGAAAGLVDATADALLLRRARPGTPMPWRASEPLDDIAELAASLLSRLWATQPGPYRFPTLAEVYPEDERIAREDAEYEQRQRGEPHRGRPGLHLLPAAAAAAEHLISTTRMPMLLHGDFITKNLLRDDTSPLRYIAIDPMAHIGDPAAEVAAFAAYQPAHQILPMAEVLATRTGVDPGRTLCWTAVWTVHQTTQAWRDDQVTLERLVVSPTIKRLLMA